MSGARWRAFAWFALALAAAGLVVALWAIRVHSCALGVGGDLVPRCASRLAADTGSAAVWTAVAAIVLVGAVRRGVRELRRERPGARGLHAPTGS